MFREGVGSPISDVFVGAPVFVLERPVPVVPVVFFFFFPHRVCVCVSKVLITVISSRAHLPSTPQVPHPPPTTTNTKVTPPLALVELAIALPKKCSHRRNSRRRIPKSINFYSFHPSPVKTSRGQGVEVSNSRGDKTAAPASGDCGSSPPKAGGRRRGIRNRIREPP